MTAVLTAVYIHGSEGFIGFQEATLDDARVNPREAAAMVTEANREFVEESLQICRAAPIQRLRYFDRHYKSAVLPGHLDSVCLQKIPLRFYKAKPILRLVHSHGSVVSAPTKVA